LKAFRRSAANSISIYVEKLRGIEEHPAEMFESICIDQLKGCLRLFFIRLPSQRKTPGERNLRGAVVAGGFFYSFGKALCVVPDERVVHQRQRWERRGGCQAPGSFYRRVGAIERFEKRILGGERIDVVDAA